MKKITTPHPKRDAPIGLFDSGVGGLSVLKHIRQQLPQERLIYVADTAWMPYGEQTTEAIRQRTLALADSLIAAGCKMLILACNTATAAAVREVRREWPRIPVVGMEPGLKPAISSSHRRRVGILATRGTLRSDKFRLLLERYGSGTEVICQPCPGLVELVEQGALEHAETEALLRRYLAPLLEQGIDALVLGCTHYPFLIPIIRRLMDDSVSLVDTGEAVARQARRILDEQGLRSPSPAPGATLFHTTGDPEKQRAIFRLLWGDEVEIGAWRAD